MIFYLLESILRAWNVIISSLFSVAFEEILHDYWLIRYDRVSWQVYLHFRNSGLKEEQNRNNSSFNHHLPWMLVSFLHVKKSVMMCRYQMCELYAAGKLDGSIKEKKSKNINQSFYWNAVRIRNAFLTSYTDRYTTSASKSPKNQTSWSYKQIVKVCYVKLTQVTWKYI